jgi:hypothetical protein
MTAKAPKTAAKKTPVEKKSTSRRSREPADDEEAVAEADAWNAADDDQRPPEARTPNAEWPYSPVRLTLPRWYIERIDEEAEVAGFRRRADFLGALVRRAAGRFPFERPAHGRKIEPPQLSELGPDERYMWHCPKETKVLLDELCEHLGRVSPKAWVIIALREYMKLPVGAAPKRPGK